MVNVLPYLKCLQRLCGHEADIVKNCGRPHGFLLCQHRRPHGSPLCTHECLLPTKVCRLLQTFVYMEISERPLRKHKLLADVADIFNLEKFSTTKEVSFSEVSEYSGKCQQCLLLADICPIGQFKTQSVDDVIYISVDGSVCHVVYTQ